MAKVIYSYNSESNEKGDWIKIQRSEFLDGLVIGVKKTHVAPVFNLFARNEVVELRNTLNEWLRETHTAKTTGEL